MNGDPGRRPDDPDDSTAEEAPDAPDADARDGATPLPASDDQQRRASDSVESDQSIAGEEDPGAALDMPDDPNQGLSRPSPRP